MCVMWMSRWWSQNQIQITNKMEATIEMQGKRGTEHMPFSKFVRWACLIEAMEVISDKCDQLKMPRADTSWVKPGAIEKYIGERESSMTHELERELKGPRLLNVRPKRDNILSKV